MSSSIEATAAQEEIVYVACPYSAADPKVTEYRVELFARTSARLMKQGYMTFSPVMNHLVRKFSDLPGDWDYWQHYCRAFLKKSSKLLVLRIPGWDTSTGVSEEIRLATEWNIPIQWYDPHVEDLAAMETSLPS